MRIFYLLRHVFGIVGRVEGTANAIIDVLTVVGGIGFTQVTCFKTKSISTHKAEEYLGWMILTDETRDLRRTINSS